MRYQQQKNYKSIVGMPPFVFPQFTLLVGKNGSGKTQLLEAIQNGDVACFDDSGKKLEKNEIRRFTWQDFLPKNEPQVGQNKLDQQRQTIWHAITNSQNNLRLDLQSKLRNNRLTMQFEFDTEMLLHYEEEDFSDIIGTVETAVSAYTFFETERATGLRRQLDTLRFRRRSFRLGVPGLKAV